MKVSTYTTHIQFGIKSTDARERNKGFQIGKEDVELSVCRWYVIYIYIERESRKTLPRKLLELINEFSEVSGYKN